MMFADSSTLITVATCSLNQWALDFDGNLERIAESCKLAKEQGAKYRLGPELEICGYGCEDHFLESDTIDHCWESLVELLTTHKASDGLLCDFGMPVFKDATRYNCRVLCWNGKILMIRPKSIMADHGNYRESRYFTPYTPTVGDDSIQLPVWVAMKLNQQDMTSVPFGMYAIRFKDGVTFGCESCEELWTPQAPHIDMSLQGVLVIGNGSGSHHELRKLTTRLDLIKSATKKCGGVYLYSNQRGCDGGRLYFDGGALIVCNGNVLAQSSLSQFNVKDVDVISATIDLEQVISYRASIPSSGMQAAKSLSHATTATKWINGPPDALLKAPSTAIPTFPCDASLIVPTPPQECCLGPACWLWDYLRRSGASGFLLPLSGGADSSSVATIVGAMSHLVINECKIDPNGQVAADVRRMTQQDTLPSTPHEFCKSIFSTLYLGTVHSSNNTKRRAQELSNAIGSNHWNVPIDTIVTAILSVFSTTCGGDDKMPKFESQGGNMTQDLALQNLQARIRMIVSYLFAQLLPWVQGKQSGFLLVLASANVDEALRGYMTKYDCSSADLNPIGAISKGDLRSMLLWASKEYDWKILEEIALAPPTAELRPQQSTTITTTNDNNENSVNVTTTTTTDTTLSTVEHSQLDEDEMGMTYAELGVFGKLRKISRCGPVSMFRQLCVLWASKTGLTPTEIAIKVQRFFRFYSINRHKLCTLTPSYHAEGYSPDDNRFDLRPFLYNTKWTRQFNVMNQLAKQKEQQQQQEEHEKSK